MDPRKTTPLLLSLALWAAPAGAEFKVCASTPSLGLAANADLDAEVWQEADGEKHQFSDDVYGTLKDYLDRARLSLARPVPSLAGFAEITSSEVARLPVTFKTQGIAFDGATPLFSWRYGLQRTDARYKETLTRPLAIPPDIQAAHYDPARRNGFSHIGDIDVAGGRLLAPIEDEDNRTKPFIALFDPKTLEYTGEKHLLPVDKLPHGVPWVAADAERRLFYTMNWNSQDLQVFSLDDFRWLRTVPLSVVRGTSPVVRVQGGKVHEGMLYLSSDAPGRKRVYKVDPDGGGALELFGFDEPEKAASQGLAFGPDGSLHILVLAPYSYDEVFGPQYEINGDDWNPASKLLHFTRVKAPLRQRLCASP
ncbi:MAG: hypothetical protein HYZ75_04235 [Elusimicrobia bacterium]|nr:hypothetical protein [Elusimicrobiota bacterium]